MVIYKAKYNTYGGYQELDSDHNCVIIYKVQSDSNILFNDRYICRYIYVHRYIFSD